MDGNTFATPIFDATAENANRSATRASSTWPRSKACSIWIFRELICRRTDSRLQGMIVYHSNSQKLWIRLRDAGNANRSATRASSAWPRSKGSST